ncbi:hypothetical protein [Fredinandcohnia quinoae]|uniref:Uncharacterized protein n=1 Tax=Fredinandcohnia quinoae TaxID=2918902 RepID=A0AAW5DYE9_9BACI|nr:hypothetical protein [Fredinandcohnia sp. SECRCQ15]MCH1625108.1 hypothetical protein [Fredinandcohnia sp. SECRCQ15]
MKKEYLGTVDSFIRSDNMTNVEMIIEIDKITSGKNNVISFERKGKQIDQAPLKLKPYSESSDYHYNHHFDKNDLEQLSEIYPSIYPNYSQKNINSWANEIKKALRHLIETGQLDKIYDYHGQEVSVKYIWVNELESS